MIRDPFYRQIIERLSGMVDPELFEQCAADLLRAHYPTLVPILGGSDAGMDGAIDDTLGEPYPLVSTAGADVIGNLTRNLKSYLKKGGKRRKLVLATSQSLTPKRKQNLSSRARELGFTLNQVYDQPAIANLLYRNSKWCLELLGLAGEPPALSAIPKSDRPSLNQELVGRDSDLAWLRDSDGDRLLIGQPGSGKTFLMLNLLENGALFVVSKDRAEIAAGIRDEMPATLIVDDAGANLEIVSDLKQIREETGAEFSVLASCWPGDQVSVTQILNLPSSSVRHLELLTRDEIVDVIKAAGLVGPDELIHEIVNQADGRPGLAATLADLSLRGGVKEVAFGEALSESIRFISRKVSGENTVEVLAAFSVGGASGMSMQLIADQLGLGLVQVRHIVTDLAAAGIVYEVDRQLLSVRPAALRFVLVRDVFFKGAASLPVESLLSQAPNLAEAVRTILGAKARGATIPQPFLTGLLEQIDSGEDWALYASLGREETSWILQHYPEKVRSIAQPALHGAADIAIPLLLRQAVGDQRDLHSTPEHSLRLISDWAHSGYPGTGEGVRRRKVLFECVQSWFKRGGDKRVGFMALQAALSPVFADHTTDPGIGRNVTIRRGFLSKNELIEIHSFWANAVELMQTVEIADWQPIQSAIEDWAYPGRVHSVPSELAETMRDAAGQMLRDIVACAASRPGVLQWAEKIADHIDEPNIEIPVNAEFETLHPKWNAEDLKAAGSGQAEAVSDLAAQWSSLDAKEVAEKIVRIELEAQSVGLNWPNWTAVLCEEIAQRAESPLVWATALIDAEAAGDTIIPFLRRAAGLDEKGWSQIAATCLDEPRLKLYIVALVITLKGPPGDLLIQTLDNMEGAVTLTNFHCIRNEVNEGIISLLLRHQNADIASAAALGVWQAEPYGNVPDTLYVEWREAIKNSTSDDFWLSKILKEDSALSFEWLQRRLSELPIELYRLENAVNAATDALGTDDRWNILHQLRIDYPHNDLVERLVGDDLDLYRAVLNDMQLKPFHLMPLAGKPEDVWIDKAKLVLDAGYDPEDIANEAYPHFMSWWGEESTMWSERAEQFDRLLSYEDKRIQKVGELGKAKVEASRDRALIRERQESIHGIR